MSSNKGGDAAPPNARAGSMKTKGVVGLQQNQNQDYEYEGDKQQNSKPISSKHKMTNNISNVDQNISSSLLSEKLDKRHVVNLSTGNQKNIKVS